MDERISLKIENLTCGYPSRPQVLKGFYLDAEGGSLISLLGKNGAGKTTLFKAVLGMLGQYEGSIRICGKEANRMTASELASLVAYIPQNGFQAFDYTVMDMVLMGVAGKIPKTKAPGTKEENEALMALETVGLSGFAQRSFMQLSGGEQQLVRMARAIIQDAAIWLLDEPLSNLDYGNQIRVIRKLKELSEKGYLILQSIHNPDFAYLYSDQVAALSEGRLLRFGNPGETMDETLIAKLYGEDISWIPPIGKTDENEE